MRVDVDNKTIIEINTSSFTVHNATHSNLLVEVLNIHGQVLYKNNVSKLSCSDNILEGFLK